MDTSIASQLIAAACDLSRSLSALEFPAPIAHVYNPLEYAWACHEMYLRRYASGRKRVLFLGMNPGPFGMVQTGIPFGEIAAVRDWMKISAPVCKPASEHPRRPVDGFDCRRSEVSGFRLWGLFASRYPNASDFFAEHFVANYCPLAFVDESGRNLTPAELRGPALDAVFRACDKHLRQVVGILEPEWLVGIGGFAERRARLLFESRPVRLAGILHPSPASPAANRDWAARAEATLCEFGIWSRRTTREQHG